MKKLRIILLILAALLGAVYVRFYTFAPAHYKEVRHPTPNLSKGRNRLQGVVLHHTATFTAQQSLRTLTSTKTKVSCHVLIDYDGTRYILAEPKQISHHAGYSTYHGRNWCNNFMIGIEFQGCTNVAPLTNQQIASAVEYLTPIIKQYDISLDNVVTHKMVRDEWNDTHPDRRTATKPDITSRDHRRVLRALREAGL